MAPHCHRRGEIQLPHHSSLDQAPGHTASHTKLLAFSQAPRLIHTPTPLITLPSPWTLSSHLLSHLLGPSRTKPPPFFKTPFMSLQQEASEPPPDTDEDPALIMLYGKDLSLSQAMSQNPEFNNNGHSYPLVANVHYYPKSFSYINLFNLHNIPMMYYHSLFPDEQTELKK